MKSGEILFNKYKIIRELGQGGFGKIYLARQLSLNRKIVIKVIKETKRSSEKAFLRFKKEALLISKINHPNIVKYYDLEKDEHNNYYLIMEYIEGMTLKEVLKKGIDLPIERIVSMIRDICYGLNEVHKHNIVHRDIKPSNIILNDERAVLIDFGLLKDLNSKEGLTGVGKTVGTPLYMAPEQVFNQEIGPWTDIYSFAVVIYELITGYNPFRAENRDEIIKKQLSFKPENLFHIEGAKKVSRAFALTIARALNKSPEKRFKNAIEFYKAIEKTAFFDDSPTSLRVTEHMFEPENRKKNFYIILFFVIIGIVIGIFVGTYLF